DEGRGRPHEHAAGRRGRRNSGRRHRHAGPRRLSPDVHRPQGALRRGRRAAGDADLREGRHGRGDAAYHAGRLARAAGGRRRRQGRHAVHGRNAPLNTLRTIRVAVWGLVVLAVVATAAILGYRWFAPPPVGEAAVSI